MDEFKDIGDDQICIIGESGKRKHLFRSVLIIIIVVLALVIIGVKLLVVSSPPNVENEKYNQLLSEPALFEPNEINENNQSTKIGKTIDSIKIGYTEIKDTFINDIPIRIFIPHNAEMILHVGKLDRKDKNVIYAAQAADVRADNGGIVGAFVLKGEPLAWGLSKRGFCASINGKVTIGVAENSPLFEKATEESGYFFRQYPLVDNGRLIDNEPRGKSIRRAICERQGEIFMVETGTVESFHDFAQALVDLGVKNAVYLVGSSAYGWAVDEKENIYEFGKDDYYNGRRKIPENISYIVWKRDFV